MGGAQSGGGAQGGRAESGRDPGRNRGRGTRPTGHRGVALIPTGREHSSEPEVRSGSCDKAGPGNCSEMGIVPRRRDRWQGARGGRPQGGGGVLRERG